MKKVLLVFGTRPEAIKMAPLVKEFDRRRSVFDMKVCVTAQHRKMLDQVLDFFEIEPDYDLNLMKPNQNLYSLTADILMGMKSVLDDFNPDYVFVHGDTTTSFVVALASFYGGFKVCHVEAGLRTSNKWSPFPEEMNRCLTGRLADIHFAPTKQAAANLIREGVHDDQIVVTGNTVIDALLDSVETVKTLEGNSEIENLMEIRDSTRSLILVTGHRRENFGQGFLNICEAIKEISRRSDVEIIYPVHLNPNVQKPVTEILTGLENVKLIAPLSYPAFVWLMNQAKLILTDSGGVQEEAPTLGKPVLVMRDATERYEAVEEGTVILVGTDKARIVSETFSLLDDSMRYKTMSELYNPYGDGDACRRIVDFLSDRCMCES